MDRLKTYDDHYPVHDDYCETVMGTVIEGKNHVYASEQFFSAGSTHLIAYRPIDKCRLQRARQTKMSQHVRRAALRRQPRMWHELAAGPPCHVYIPACAYRQPSFHGDASRRRDVSCIPMLIQSIDTEPPQRKDVVRAIHATSAMEEWTECRGKIHTNFATAHSNASITVLPRVLARIPVMLFAGDQDLICNYMGIERLIQTMEWNGATGLGVSVAFVALALLQSTGQYGPSLHR